MLPAPFPIRRPRTDVASSHRRGLRRAPLLAALAVSSACFSAAPGTTADERVRTEEHGWVYGTESSASSPTRAWTRSSTAREARLSGDDSQLLVEARLNGRFSGVFLLDTGASYCVITPATARRLGLDREDATRAITLATPTGEIEAPLMTLKSIEVANARAGQVSVVVYPAVEEPLAGILGLSFLSQFEFAVDARRRVLKLRPF